MKFSQMGYANEMSQRVVDAVSALDQLDSASSKITLIHLLSTNLSLVDENAVAAIREVAALAFHRALDAAQAELKRLGVEVDA